MVGRDRRHSRWWTLLAVVLVVAGGLGILRTTDRGADLLAPAETRVQGWWDDLTGAADEPDPDTEPAAVPAPEGLDLPPVTAPDPVAATITGGALDKKAVQRTLAKALDAPSLGRHVAYAVAPLTAGARPVVQAGGAATPASTTKLLTSLAALSTLDPGTRFTTSVVRQGSRVVLVGGGDPYLAREPVDPTSGTWPERADVVTLARKAAKALTRDGLTAVRLGYDDTLFSGPAFNPHWPASYRGDVVAPITALWVDEGRPAVGLGRVEDPSRVAAEAFADALTKAGVRVQGEPRPIAAPPGAAEVAQVQSAPLDQVVERLLQVSDNEATEVLLRHVGLAVSGEGSTQAGVAAVEKVLTQRGVPLPKHLYDGSGLSREDLISPATFVGLLQAVAGGDADDPARALLAGLPVAAFSGSLDDRFTDAPAAAVGDVRAKTGTLTGVRSLAGVAVTRDGVPLVFSLMADRIGYYQQQPASDVLDRAAAALAACRCGAQP